jgi:hypothetical protein
MREQLAAAIGASAHDYVAIRAIVATGRERDDRIARLTAMGREFVTEVRRRARDRDVAALLAEPPSLRERVLECATCQIVLEDGRELVTMQRLSRDGGIPRRTLYNMYSASELDAACRRRSQTIWRARFEHAVLGSTADPKRRLFAVFDTLGAWVGSDRFRADQALCARPAITERQQDDDMREHLAEIDRFATELGAAARLAAPGAFAAFVVTSVAGALGWYDRRAAAHSASIAFVEREIARRR